MFELKFDLITVGRIVEFVTDPAPISEFGLRQLTALMGTDYLNVELSPAHIKLAGIAKRNGLAIIRRERGYKEVLAKLSGEVGEIPGSIYININERGRPEFDFSFTYPEPFVIISLGLLAIEHDGYRTRLTQCHFVDCGRGGEGRRWFLNTTVGKSRPPKYCCKRHAQRANTLGSNPKYENHPRREAQRKLFSKSSEENK